MYKRMASPPSPQGSQYHRQPSWWMRRLGSESSCSGQRTCSSLPRRTGSPHPRRQATSTTSTARARSTSMAGRKLRRGRRTRRAGWSAGSPVHVGHEQPGTGAPGSSGRPRCTAAATSSRACSESPSSGHASMARASSSRSVGAGRALRIASGRAAAASRPRRGRCRRGVGHPRPRTGSRCRAPRP